ncbi:Rrf2 family transcriptional regulator [Streptococcus caballi]|uniref:Rrf2 family transcriptional regulator n=1 Tax=Streptococcus caballi TaxID=439220 RepID=UPI00037998DB|nr:Rrf2 family transcriptional regulator [Streptococcus caballi]
MANHRLSDLLQILVYVEVHHTETISSERLAASLKSNPSLVRQMLSQLRKAGIITTQRGKVGFRIEKPLAELTVLDVYRTIDNQGDLLKVDQNTAKTCSVGVAFPEVLQSHYHDIQKQAEAQMAKISLKQLVDETRQNILDHTQSGG